MKKNKFKIKIFADGADIASIKKLSKNKLIDGFTTNPSLMKAAGVKNYLKFAQNLSKTVKNKPVSLEVFSDDLVEMKSQAVKLGKISNNFNIKIPITNSKGLSTAKLIKELSADGVVCNVTAIFTLDQIKFLMKHLPKNTNIILSVFAGRIADTGYDAEKLIRKIKKFLKPFKNAKILWASTREVFNIIQAQRCGCNIITVPYSILEKLKDLGKSQKKFSLETVKMFKEDAIKAGFRI